MTPIHKFRPRWIERCAFRRKYLLRDIALIVASLLALYGLWYSVTTVRESESRVAEERRKTMLAERTTNELMEVLSGNLVMVDANGKYAYQAEVKWQLVEVAK